MTGDALFAWMRGHRIDPDGCSRCGRPNIVYFRDHAERPVGFCCVVDAAAIAREANPYDETAELVRRLEGDRR